MLPWMIRTKCVEAWLSVRQVEPIATVFAIPVLIVLNSEEAKKARKSHAEIRPWNTPRTKTKLNPSPQERVAILLKACEEKDVRHFVGLCREMTLDETSTHYSFSRSVKNTPGWSAASDDERKRIVAVAKRLLISNHDEAERSKTLPLSQMLVGHITALWLVMDEDSAWVQSLPTDWWRIWTWYFLRELHLHMFGEANDNKKTLLEMLHAKVPDEVRDSVRSIVQSQDAETKSLLSGILEVLADIVDPALDEMLCTLLEAGQITEDKAGEVAQFVLERNNDRATSACLSRLNDAALAASETVAVRAAVALLHQGASESWKAVFDLLERRSDLAVRVLGDFAHSDQLRKKCVDERNPPRQMRSTQMGQLLDLLLMHFPPEGDPNHGTGAHFVGPDDSARYLRTSIVDWLGEQRDIEAVTVLRELEAKYRAKYSWLRRPRSRAERAYRLATWFPIQPRVTAELLAARDKYLIRNHSDALDGVVAAIEDYGRKLRTESPSDVDDLWNRPRGVPATPKEEERVSDKICVAIRDYFREFAVVADREVQIARRKVVATAGGAPGSEVDVKYEVPAVGTVNGDAIVIPIEVKLSHNREARTGMKDQLVDRYMRELGTDTGVYVVAWVGSNCEAGYRALWPCPAPQILIQQL